MKQMGLDLNTSNNNPVSISSFHKRNHLLVKLAVCFLLLGLAFRLFFSSSFVEYSSPSSSSSSVATTDSPLDLPSPATDSPDFADFPVNETRPTHSEKCDIFIGNWVADPSPPLYTNDSCHMIEAHQNCMMNGRPDTGYLHWRWDPLHCELPKFNPKRFLYMMRHKSWAFVGDSILRNHVQSIVCSLSQVEQAIMVYHDEGYKSKTWRFPSHNFTLAVIWAPFLAKANISEDNNGVSTSIIRLYLDKLDEVWTDQYNNYNYVLIAGGEWFLKNAIYYENSTVVGCHNCNEKNVTELGFFHAYRKVLRSVFNYFTRSNHRVDIFFRTVTPDHFENGEWNTGGYCNRTVPFEEGEVNLTDINSAMREIELAEFETASERSSKKGMKMKLLDTTYLSLLRPDGHPSVYRQFQPFAKDKNAKVQRDCLHWCLPGPIDSWNSLLMEMLLND